MFEVPTKVLYQTPLRYRMDVKVKVTYLAECTFQFLVESPETQSADMARTMIAFRHRIVLHGLCADPANCVFIFLNHCNGLFYHIAVALRGLLFYELSWSILRFRSRNRFSTAGSSSVSSSPSIPSSTTLTSWLLSLCLCRHYALNTR